MRLGWAAAAVIIATAACGSSSAAFHSSSGVTSTAAVTTAAGPAATCGPTAAKAVAANRQARVYSSGGSLFGCAASGSRRSYRLGSTTICIRSARAGPVALAGTIVAYGLQMCGVDTGSGRVVVQRLSDGRQLRSLDATTNPLGPESYQAVGSLVVRADGAVAWIGVAHSIVRHSQDTEVHRADRRGEAELDSGAAVDPSSLQLQGSKLTWRSGGATRTATLV